MTILPLRILLFITGSIILFIIAKVCYLGSNLRTDRSSRKAIMQSVFKCFSFLLLALFGIVVEKKVVKADYTDWLGSNYQELY